MTTTKTFYLELHHVGKFKGPMRMATILEFIPELSNCSSPDISVNQLTTYQKNTRIDICEVTIPLVAPPGDLYIYSLGADNHDPKQIVDIQKTQVERLNSLGGSCLPLLRGKLGLQAGLQGCDITPYQRVFLKHQTRMLH